MKWGYIPSERESEGTSKTLEYSFDDACISAFAASLGKDSLVERFTERSLSWRNILHPESHFIQPKRDGAWIPNFNPTEVNFNYTEANGWQYTFFAPHDISGQISLASSPDAFSQLVENQFSATTETSGRHQVDITGLIGQYAHGNEPSHHVAYLQSYVGKQWRTSEIVNEILTDLYTSEPDGLCGNEDCGQMSAWYVLSSIGLYPVSPGSSVNSQKAQLVIGAPQFENVIVTPAKSTARSWNRPLFISKDKTGPYVRFANGQTRSWLYYNEILNGGALIFETSMDSNNGFGVLEGDRPSTTVNDANFVPVPAFVSPRSFQGKRSEVILHHLDAEAKIYVRLDDNDWFVYKNPIVVKSNVELYAYAEVNGVRSKEVHHAIVKIENEWEVKLTYPYSPQYEASGTSTLVDGLRGGDEYRTGDWQGYYATPFEATIDLGKSKTITSMTLGCIQDIRPWIWLPENVEFFTSTDGVNFELLERVTHNVLEDDYENQVFRFKTNSMISDVRFVRVKANPRGLIPEWHLGAGFDRWTFVDEWEITYK